MTMSKNVRQVAPTTPVKVSKRRASDVSSSLDLSDEDGYSGVEDISDSDDDEEDVNAAEEEHILSDELHHTIRSSPRPRDEDNEQGDDEDEDEDEDDDDDDDAEEDDYEGDEDDEDDNGSWAGIISDTDTTGHHEHVPEQEYTAAVPRRVRFDVPDSSDDDSTETDEDLDSGFFPDLFVDKSTLDPTFRREIESDPFPDDSSASDGVWDPYSQPPIYPDKRIQGAASDFEALIAAMAEEDSSTPVATPMTHHDMSTAVSTPVASPEKDDVSLDGYRTDGDTTDEEDPPERLPRRKTRRETVEEDSSSDSDVVTLIRPRRGQPRVGRFDLDKSSKKPIAILNPRTGKMMIFTHQTMRGRGFDLSPEQFNFQFFDQPQSSPILSNPGNIMMSGMISSSTYGDFMNTHAVGPAEAWYAQGPDGSAVAESSDSDGPMVDDEEKNLKLEDFVTLGDDSSDDDDDAKLIEDEVEDVFRTPARPGTASSDVTSLLDHFEHNANIVGAFRRDQANHQLISRSKATRESLAFSGPYFEGTLRGIKDGRIATTNVPISPLRRQKKMPDLASSPLAPISQKRKAASENHLGHKRQRSIPDVEPLRI